jgi:hypothetical protein
MMKIQGNCHCGAIAYEADVDPAKSTICNCNDCQSFSGSPWRASVPALAQDFRLLRGTPKTYEKIAESGTRRLQAFCGDCGSAIYATSAGNQRVFNLRLGAIRQRAELAPRRQIWTDAALPWASDITDIPGVPKD